MQAETPRATTSIVLGDVDCSGSVSLDDAVKLRQVEANAGSPAGCLAVAGDTNCSGSPDTVDALWVLRFLAGLPNTVPAGCAAIGESSALAPTSFELIDTALEDERIDLATALLYKAYAAFEVSGLPAEFQGDDRLVQENPFLHEVPDAWSSLSEGERGTLLPYLLPPNLEDSWYAQQDPGFAPRTNSDWASIDSLTLPVKAWYHSGTPGDGARAASVISALETTVWNSLTGVMGKSPLPDCGAGCPSGGGDDRLDIYVVAPSVRSYVSWNPPNAPDCTNVPTFMVLGDTADWVVAHELMHTIQLAYDGPADCHEYRWFREASAQWAVDYVYPSANDEQVGAWSMLLFPETRLDLADDRHEYAAYLFPFFLSREMSPQIVRDIWQTGESKVGNLVAINQVTAGSGGLAELWPKFALQNWNREPVADYRAWDGLEMGARAYEETLGSGETDLTESVEYLGATYYSWEFPAETGFVDFTNTLAGRPHTQVQAIARIDGTWQEPEDWTEKPRKSFCRNLPDQDIDRLVIIISNSDWQGKTTLEMGTEPPTLVAVESDCKALVGSAKTTSTTSRTVAIAMATDIRFEFDDAEEDLPSGDYRSVSGTVTWTYEGTNGNCTVSGGGSFPVDNGEGRVFIGAPDQAGERRYYASGVRPPGDPYKATMSCPDSDPFLVNPSFNWIWLMASVSSGHTVDEDGNLRGTDSQLSGGGSSVQTWEWDLSPAP